MYQLVYISAATQVLSENDVLTLLDQARGKNELDGITGLLMYHDAQFFQVLEGPKLAVKTCFKRISKDPRHKGLIILSEEECTARMFSEWRMAMAKISAFREPLKSQLTDLLQVVRETSANEVQQNRVISIFIDTFLSDLHRFARHVSL